MTQANNHAKKIYYSAFAKVIICTPSGAFIIRVFFLFSGKLLFLNAYPLEWDTNKNKICNRYWTIRGFYLPVNASLQKKWYVQNWFFQLPIKWDSLPISKRIIYEVDVLTWIQWNVLWKEYDDTKYSFKTLSLEIIT